jgi:hypothetical protein
VALLKNIAFPSREKVGLKSTSPVDTLPCPNSRAESRNCIVGGVDVAGVFGATCALPVRAADTRYNDTTSFRIIFSQRNSGSAFINERFKPLGCFFQWMGILMDQRHYRAAHFYPPGLGTKNLLYPLLTDQPDILVKR